MKRAFLYLKHDFRKMCGGLTLKLLGAFSQLLIPWILARIIDDVLPTGDAKPVILLGVCMLLCAVLTVVCNIWANRISAYVAGSATERLRRDLFNRTIRLSARDIDRFTIPSLISRLTSDTYEIQRMLGVVQRMGVRAPMIMLGGIVITLTLDPVLSLIMLAAMPPMAVITVLLSRRGVRLYKQARRTGDDMLRVVRENVTGVRVVKALSKGEYEKRRFNVQNRRLTESERSAGRTLAGVDPLMSVVLNLALVAVIFAGAQRVNAGLAEVGKIVAFLSYITMIFNSLLAVTRLFSMFSRASASAGRIFEVLDCPAEPLLNSGDSLDGFDPSAPAVRFESVSFRYPGSGFAIENVSFEIGCGETLGVIGATGSGKSTLLRLLLRFYSPDSGKIYLHGHDISGLSASALRSRFGVVFQNDILFAGSIAENLDFDRALSSGQLERALDISCAAEFVDDMNAEVAIKGANFSGGQKQRLMIARAIAGEPDILLLDDSSSALDYITDSELRGKLDTKTVSTNIIIAQRVSSIMRAGRIIVLENGHIAGIGRHDELMESCPIYRETYEVQMGGGEIER